MKYSVWLCVMILSFSAWSQCDFTLTGKVYDLHDGKVISDARITLKNEGKGAYSDSLGYYQIPNLCSGEHQLVVSHHLGCEPLKMSFTLEADTNINLFIEFHLLELDDMEASHFRLNRNLENEAQLNTEDRRSLASQNLGNQLSKLPGVSVISTGSSVSKPVVRGLHSNRVLVWNDGVRQEGQQWGGEHGPEVDPFFYSDISVVKGPGEIRYGADAMGGIVRASLDNWPKDKAFFFNSQSGFASNGRQGFQSLLLGGQVPKMKGLKWKVGSSAKMAGDQQTAQYYLTNTGYRELNVLALVVYEKNKNKWQAQYSQFNTELGVLKASHLGNLSDLKQAISSDRPLVEEPFSYTIQSPKQQINHEIVKLAWDYRFSSKLKLETDASRQFNNRLEYDADSKEGEVDFQLNLITYQANSNLNWKLNDQHVFDFGFQLQYQENKRAGRFLVPNYKQKNAGIYGQWKRTTNKWITEAGIRMDMAQQSAFSYIKDSLVTKSKQYDGLAGNLGVSRVFGHHWVLKERVSYRWRMPNISELYSNGLHHGAAAIEVGNENLTEEEMFAHQTSAQFKSKRFQANVDLYQYYFLNYIYLKPGDVFVLSIKGAFPEFAYEQTKALVNGFEAECSYEWSSWLEQGISYAMVRAIDLEQKAFLFGIPADQISSELIFSLPFWESKLKVNNQWVSKQNRVEPGVDFAPTPEGYFLMDVDFGMQIPSRKGAYYLNFGITNLTNSAYRSYLSRYRYFADNLGRNFTLTFTINL